MPCCFTAPFTEISGCTPTTVNSDIFAIILFSRITLRHVCDVKNSRLENDLPTSVNGSDFAIFARFYFRETSQMRSFAKTSRKFLNLQYQSIVSKMMDA